MTAMHCIQVVKVNAPVDRGIVPLVMAFNCFPEILTLDSCEDGPEGAYVYFRLSQNNGPGLPLFCRELAAHLSALNLRDNGLRLCLEWCGDFSECMAQLVLPPEKIDVVTSAISRMTNRHKNRSSCGRLPSQFSSPSEPPAP